MGTFWTETHSRVPVAKTQHLRLGRNLPLVLHCDCSRKVRAGIAPDSHLHPHRLRAPVIGVYGALSIAVARQSLCAVGDRARPAQGIACRTGEGAAGLGGWGRRVLPFHRKEGKDV
jgi:hypothetical protein